VAAVLASAVKHAHWLLDATFADVDDELANRPAPGQANPLGTAYAHVAHAEDAVVNGLLQGREPLCASTPVLAACVDQPMPMPGMSEGDMGEGSGVPRSMSRRSGPTLPTCSPGPRMVLEAAAPRVAASLRPGGWLVLGRYAAPADRLAEAIADLRTVRGVARRSRTRRRSPCSSAPVSRAFARCRATGRFRFGS
jgi:hypothetical protein